MQAGMYRSRCGVIKGIWEKRGLDVPFHVAQLTSYEVTKNLYLKVKKQWLTAASSGSGEEEDGTELELSPVDSAVCGAISGSFSAAITSPLDQIRTLLMTDSGAYGGS
eukprot:4589819-Ditylum_brightwellii.AAC.1